MVTTNSYALDYSYGRVHPKIGKIFAFLTKEDAIEYIGARIGAVQIWTATACFSETQLQFVSVAVDKTSIERFWNHVHGGTFSPPPMIQVPRGTVLCDWIYLNEVIYEG